MKTIELIINEAEGDEGVFAISMVENPAIELDFVALSEQKAVVLQKTDDDQMVVLGAALVPDKPIYRISPEGEEYNIIFSKQTVKQASEIYMREMRGHNVTLDHAEVAENIYLTESWIVEDPKMDKAAHYGMEVPKGTWMVSMKVNDPVTWQNVKAGKLLGFSIEGMFQKTEELSKSEQLCDQILKIIEE